MAGATIVMTSLQRDRRQNKWCFVGPAAVFQQSPYKTAAHPAVKCLWTPPPKKNNNKCTVGEIKNAIDGIFKHACSLQRKASIILLHSRSAPVMRMVTVEATAVKMSFWETHLPLGLANQPYSLGIIMGLLRSSSNYRGLL